MEKERHWTVQVLYCLIDLFRGHKGRKDGSENKDESISDDYEKKVPADILSNLKMISEDIEHNKQWHWRFMYNVFVIFGLIIWIHRKTPVNTSLDLVLIIMSWITVLVGISLMCWVQCKLKKCREKAEHFQDMLPKYFRVDDRYMDSPVPFSTYAIGAIVVGAVAVHILIWFQVLKAGC